MLESIRSPADLKRVPAAQLEALAAEIRRFLVESVSRTGGHLGSNLGAVELTLALHRVFDSPHDALVWDTGHQAYVHKLLTGRAGGFARLRQAGGLSGYPARAESPHDLVENSHASTALSYADGLAKAFALQGQADRAVVAVVGDGALTGGMCWEALNNLAASDRGVVVVVNDNGRSYAPTVGGLADRLSGLRLHASYEDALAAVRDRVSQVPVIGTGAYRALHGLKVGLKDLLQPRGLFEDLGFKYVGPIDGHDVAALERALRRARAFGRPVIVHCLTRKGFGYPPAESDDVDCLHAVGTIDPRTGRPARASAATWTQAFAAEMLAVGAERPDVVAVTAAMLHPVGLAAFRSAYPDRCFDVGIAEQHAVTSAAGLAMGGLHPVVCVYATFLNRAFDQVLLDVALHRCPVTFVLDRAGVTGDDGPSHNGMWDLSVFQVVPGLRIAAPRDVRSLRAQLREALDVADGPTMLRFPKAEAGPDVPAVATVGPVDVLRRDESAEVLLVSVGALAAACLSAAELVAAAGVGVTVVDPRWVKPVPDELVALAAAHGLVVTVEDSLVTGGVGSSLAQLLGGSVPVVCLGLPPAFLAHGRRADVLAATGLSADGIARAVLDRVAGSEARRPAVVALP